MKYLLSAISTLLLLSAQAQVCTPIWQQSFGGNGYDYIYNSVATDDGGSISAGYSESTDLSAGYHGGGDAWITKLDAAGNTIWSRCFGGSNYDYAYSILTTPDGGFVFCGYTESTDGDIISTHGMGDAWLVKLSSSGNIIWSHCYGGTAADNAFDLAGDGAAGFTVCGTTASVNGDVGSSHGAEDCLLFHTDQNGNLTWLRTFGGSSFDAAQSLIHTASGKYVLCGYTISSDGDVSAAMGGGDCWVLKTDASGNMEWQHSFGGSAYDFGQNLLETASGDLLVTGYTESPDGNVSNYHGNGDLLAMKLDSTGAVIWAGGYGGTGNDYGYSILGMPDGSFFIGGYSASQDGDVSTNHGDYDGWILQLSGSGAISGQRSFGGTATDVIYSLDVCPDGKIITGGYSRSANGDLAANMGLGDGWEMKLQPTVLNVAALCENQIIVRQGPGPLSIALSNIPAEGRAELYDLEGRLIMIAEYNDALILQSSTIGIYIYRVFDRKGKLAGQGKILFR